MKKVYDARDRLDAQLCADYLDSRGVRTHVQGGYLQGAVGEVPPDFSMSVWAVHDHDEALARDLVTEYLEPVPDDASQWRCPRCGEHIEAQFDICWNCGGTSR